MDDKYILSMETTKFDKDEIHSFLQAHVFTAMDVWFYCCKLLLISALFEFACLLHMRKKAEWDRQMPFSPTMSKERSDSGQNNIVPVMEGWVDKKGRIIC
jgi:hypothetical protein